MNTHQTTSTMQTEPNTALAEPLSSVPSSVALLAKEDATRNLQPETLLAAPAALSLARLQHTNAMMRSFLGKNSSTGSNVPLPEGSRKPTEANGRVQKPTEVVQAEPGH